MRVTPEDLEMLTRKKSPPATAKARKAATTPKERDIQRAILEFLKTVPGVTAWRTNSGMAMMRVGKTAKVQPVRFGFKGLSDIIGWRSGYWSDGSLAGDAQAVNGARTANFLAIEVKKPGSYPTMEQQVFLENVVAQGGIGFVAHSVDEVARGLGLR